MKRPMQKRHATFWPAPGSGAASFPGIRTGCVWAYPVTGRNSTAWPKPLNQPVDMTHLAAGASLALAVKMDLRARLFQQFGDTQDVVADQVLHLDIRITLTIAQRQASNSADVLFELIDGATSLGPVARVMDA